MNLLDFSELQERLIIDSAGPHFFSRPFLHTVVKICAGKKYQMTYRSSTKIKVDRKGGAFIQWRNFNSISHNKKNSLTINCLSMCLVDFTIDRIGLNWTGQGAIYNFSHGK